MRDCLWQAFLRVHGKDGWLEGIERDPAASGSWRGLEIGRKIFFMPAEKSISLGATGVVN
jgi:hypothetical protein